MMAYSDCCDKMCVLLSFVPDSNIVVVVVGAGWLIGISRAWMRDDGMVGVDGDAEASPVKVLVSDELPSESLGSLLSIVPSVKSVDK